MDKTSPIYKKALEMANKEYGEKSSIYRSARIFSLYKKMGGKISSSPKKGKKSVKKSSKKGLTRWFKEKWVQVVPYLEKGKIIECGGENMKWKRSAGKACRPLHRITNETPITIKELLKLHDKKDIIKMAKKKEKSPSKRVVWKGLVISK
jgi:hypothetical protein